MEENSENFQEKQQLRQPSSRLSSKSRGGEIVEVQGGHIIRSTGRKDRHSKVCTAKGPRDRRVRLSATTAIQFYDVQDRLGYDRPSKAVDWLMMKSKAAIDELAELPPWHPTSCLPGNSNYAQEQAQKLQLQQQISLHHHDCVDAEPASKRIMTMVGSEIEANPSGSSSSFLPPSLDSDSISDTIKSFFPMGGATTEGNSSNMQFHQSFQPSDLFPRTNGQSQDLSLSLQSVQDPIFLHQPSTSQTEQVQAHIQAHAFFSRANQLGFDVSGWSEQPPEIGRLQRLNSWNPYGDTSITASASAGGGYLFTSQPMQQQQPSLQQFLAQSQLLSQRGPLQSSNSPSIRNWVDPSSAVISAADNNNQNHHHQPYQTVFPINPSSFSGIEYSSGVGGGFSGFHIPARIHGEEEEHDGLSDKPSSASSDSRY